MGSYIGKADHTYSLIMRLHHNVVKTAVRTISLAYSRITFAHIASKLLLDSPEDAEFIVAKVSRNKKSDPKLSIRGGWIFSNDRGVDTERKESPPPPVLTLCLLLLVMVFSP